MPACLRRSSITCSQTCRASCLCVELTAITTLVSPTGHRPTLCMTATFVKDHLVQAWVHNACSILTAVSTGHQATQAHPKVASAMLGCHSKHTCQALQLGSNSEANLQNLFGHNIICFVLELDDLFAVEGVSGDTAKGRNSSCAVVLNKICDIPKVESVRRHFDQTRSTWGAHVAMLCRMIQTSPELSTRRGAEEHGFDWGLQTPVCH